MYKCPRCHYSTDRKSNILYHLNKKIICTPKFLDTPIDNIKSNLDKDVMEKKTHKCEHCDKAFSHSSGLTRHMKVHITTNNTTNNNINSSTNQSHNTTTYNNSHNNTNSHNTTNVTNNITINLLPFGKENIEHVLNDPDLLDRCMKEMLSQGIPDLVETIHLNQDVPENQNVKHKREHKPSKMKVYTENATGECEWQTVDAQSLADKIIYRAVHILLAHIQELYAGNESDSDATEAFDQRNTKVTNIKEKKKGIYGKIRSNVISRVKDKTTQQNT